MASRFRNVSRATLFFLLLSLALGLALYLKSRPAGRREAPRPAAREPARKAVPAPAPGSPSRAPRVPARARAPAGDLPRIAIVIDDLGNDRAAVARISRLGYPVAGAVLPALAGSEVAARELASRGKEVLLHLPMEPRGYPEARPGPGPGVIVRGQRDDEIAQTLALDLASVPGAVGVSNHMGSAATADPRVMRAVLAELAGRGLFFVDSRTTDATVAREIARELGVPSASRRVFLDDVATEDAVRASFGELLRRAKEEGEAIAVGHPYPATLAVLERELPSLEEKGVKLVKVSELVK